MRINVAALAAAAALLWGGAMLVVSIANQADPEYGAAFLALAASIYPGYEPGTGIGAIITGTIYGVVDGAIGGALFAWIYNRVAGRA
ncbi:hypothetical protein [Elongatibacter sediminis]|uniref:Uncharacterized protein n=1 Tax=Elongatibacter sediminis TaxID=3119006 RepID=A0AAW9R9V9_9GAMM